MRDYRVKLSLLGLWLVVSTCLLVFGATPESAELEVCNAGCNYDSINTAVEDASSGDVIFIHAGIHRESLNLDKPHGILTKGGATLSLSNVIISGNEQCGVRLLEKSKVKVSDSSIAHNGNAFCLSGNTELYVDKSKISSNGLILSGSSSLNLKECTVSNHNQVGLELRDTSTASITGGKVGTCETCLLITDNGSLTLDGSTVSEAGDGVQLGKSSSIEAFNSKFTGCTSGIELRDSSQANIANTKITNNDHGVLLFNGAALRIRGCRIAFNDLGIRADPGSEALVSGCDVRFYNNFEKNVVGIQRKVKNPAPRDGACRKQICLRTVFFYKRRPSTQMRKAAWPRNSLIVPIRWTILEPS